MTIEMQREKSPHIYRTNPDNPRLIERRENRRGARWEAFRLCESAAAAKAVLLKLERKKEDGTE